MDFVWNRDQAEQVRSSSESAMRRQIRGVQTTVTTYRATAATLQARAAKEQVIANTAMRMVIRPTPAGPMPVPEPDWPARRAAANRAASLREQIAALNSQIRELQSANNDLEQAIIATNRMFNQLFNETQRADRVHSGKVQSVETDISNYIRMMERIRDSFSESMSVASIAGMISKIKTAMSSSILSVIMAAKLAGMPRFCAFGGDPVNMSTGNFVYSKEDIAVPGRFPIHFERFYNAIDGTDSVLGINWTHNFNIQLHTEEDFVHIVFADGHVETFEELEENKYVSPLESQEMLTKTEDGWMLSSPSMEKYIFDQEGMLQSILDASGNQTKLEHTDGLLSKVSTLSGSLSFVYDEQKRLATLSDHTGRTMELEYSDHRLSKVTHPSGAVHQYAYDEQDLLSEVMNPLDVSIVKNEYDSNSRMVKQYLPDGGTMEYTYDDNEKTTTFTQQNGTAIVYKRDDLHRTTAVVYLDGEETFEYNVNNQRTSTTDKLGNKTQFGYDKNGNLASVENALGVKTELRYDQACNQLSSVAIDAQVKIKNTYDDDGNLVAIEDALKNRTTLSYLQNGIPETITQPDGSQIQLTYDERRNITKIVDGTGKATEYRYDALNRAVATIDGI